MEECREVLASSGGEIGSAGNHHEVEFTGPTLGGLGDQPGPTARVVARRGRGAARSKHALEISGVVVAVDRVDGYYIVFDLRISFLFGSLFNFKIYLKVQINKRGI